MADFAKLNSEEFARGFQEVLSAIHADPLENFVKHPLLINFTPTHAQTVALKIAFGKPLDVAIKKPCKLESTGPNGEFSLKEEYLTEVELYELMTGREYDPLHAIANPITAMDLIIGRRGGKSTISAILSIYFAIVRNWKPFLKKHPYATVLILSHTKEFSEEILDLIRNFIDESPILTRLLDKSDRTKQRQAVFRLAVPFNEPSGTVYSKVSIQVGAASKKTVRGKATCVALCDEIAFWNLDESSAEQDSHVLRALRPSMGQFGRYSLLIKLSSPGIRAGVLYNEWDLWTKGKLPPNYVVFKGPSWLWNEITEEEFFRNELILDPDGFGAEYRGEFVDSISTFISPEYIDLAIRKGTSFIEPEDRRADVVYAAAIDSAFKKDRFTFSLVGSIGGRVKQYCMNAWEGSKKEPIKAKDVAAYVKVMCDQFGINEVSADQYAFQPLKEIFAEFGVNLVERTFTNTYKQKIYFNLKKLIHNQQTDLLDNEELSKELKQLQVERSTTGTIRIGHPVGGHDDYCAATAISAFQVTEAMVETGGDTFAVSGAEPPAAKMVHAPPPTQLADMYGYEIEDTSAILEDYIRQADGTWVRKEVPEDEDDGGFNVLF